MRSIAMNLAQSLGNPGTKAHTGCWEMCACHYGVQADEDKSKSFRLPERA